MQKPYMKKWNPRIYTLVHCFIQLLLSSDNIPGTMLALHPRRGAIHGFYLYGSQSRVYTDNKCVMVRVNWPEVLQTVHIKGKRFFKYYMMIWLFYLALHNKLILELECISSNCPWHRHEKYDAYFDTIASYLLQNRK